MNANIRNFVAELEAAREAQLCRLANGSSGPTQNDIKSLADVQTALTAAREVLEDHQPRLGYGSNRSLGAAGEGQQWSAFRSRTVAVTS